MKVNRQKIKKVKIRASLLFISLFFLCLLFTGCGHPSRSQCDSFQVSSHFEHYTWTSPYDQVSRNDDLQLFTPSNQATCPILVFHRGRGFNYTDYTEILKRICAYANVIVVSVSDDSSFLCRDPLISANPDYDFVHPEKGIEAASYAQEEALQQAVTLSQTPSHYLFNRVDSSKAYFSGHSRGGGATEYCQSRHLSAAGFIYYMPFNLSTQLGIALPPLSSTVSLIFAATADDNLGYNGPASLINEMLGPSTLVTIWGGNHDWIADEACGLTDGFPLISRGDEQEAIVLNTVNFINRTK